MSQALQPTGNVQARRGPEEDHHPHTTSSRLAEVLVGVQDMGEVISWVCAKLHSTTANQPNREALQQERCRCTCSLKQLWGAPGPRAPSAVQLPHATSWWEGGWE